MGVEILVAVIIVLIVLGAAACLAAIYNSLVRLKNDMDKAWSNIEVLLKQRHDELPKLIETCKGYMQHEQKTLRLITDARSAYQKAQSVQEKAQADNLLSGALKTLFAVAEKYPDLKANANFRQLQGSITELEEKIGDGAELFNDHVSAYNARIRQLPDVLMTRLLKLQPRALFQVAEADRQGVAVKSI